MEEIKVSYDNTCLNEKPNSIVAAGISKRIGNSSEYLNINEIKSFALNVSLKGRTFCPATFKNGKRCKESFEQQQLFALDFDNKEAGNSVTFEEVKNRAEQYELPILFAYETLSSTNQDKFRVVFLNDTSITDRKVAEAMQLALGTIFPEADSSCYKDTSKMYYGGKNLLFRDDNIHTINIESTFRNLSYYLKNKYRANHYKEKIAKFSKETGIALNKSGLLDVAVYNPTETLGVSQYDNNGKNSPTPIIYSPNIIANGEIFPNQYYCINFISDDTSNCSVGEAVTSKKLKNHNTYRAAVIHEVSENCRLYREFTDGKRKLCHDELFGLATNLIQIETGMQNFKNVFSTYLSYHEKKDKWEYDISYMKQQGYYPQSCDKFCPYSNSCKHGKNILSTAHPKLGIMEKLPDYNPKFCSLEEVQDDTYSAIYNAYISADAQFQVIKSMTGAGKSHSYLKLMAENPNDRFLIAVPTNLLKNEIYHKAKKMGINVKRTPSLDEIRDELPYKVADMIDLLYKIGNSKAVQKYINKTVEKEDIPELKKYIRKRQKLIDFNGSVITTHKYLLNMDQKRLSEFSTIIIDEDIIFKSIISNQEELTISELKTILSETTDDKLSKKIKQLLKAAKTQVCIELEGFKLEYKKDSNTRKSSVLFDAPSFCSATKFYLRKASKERNLEEDTVAFIKPVKHSKAKYIMVSATADEKICRNYFGEENVSFYECKQAKYMGTLNQYPEKSMSRTCVSNNPGIISRLMERFCLDEEMVITFLREKIGQLHFGNTEGSNTLEGRDILVAGTPYHAEFLYKLVAFTMGLDFDEDEEMTPQIVEHNGYRFRFTTFNNENLRAVQFWMIESELEQAVGRARLLRNDCNVYLFSNFPLRQSKMVFGFDYGINKNDDL